ncbi:FAD-dependent monooxygenase [Nocardia sp. NPDC046763]|uniref:NAD(P)/FAD-dependent oxidoreductase n=1 Tax=Nocardia sp. NPDC046763 TaxID=3155256 RepID=UPI0033E7EB0A
MRSGYDVVVVGARCAGSMLAGLLAKSGLSVLLVDRAEFPSDSVSTHIMQLNGAAILARQGLTPQLTATAPALRGMNVSINGIDLSCDFPLRPGDGPGAFCIRRDTLDEVLLGFAEAAGADIELGAAVQELTITGRVVTGVSISTQDGATRTVRASLVVGADGRNSTVARAVGARRYNTVTGDRFVVWAYVPNAELPHEDRISFIRNGEDIILKAPSNNGCHMVAINPPLSLMAEAKHDPHALLHTTLRAARQTVPDASALERNRPRVRMVGRSTSYFREAAGPGWVLVGDSAMYKDPCTGQGMSDAFRHAEQLCASITRGFATGALDRELRRWWIRRDRDESRTYGFMNYQGRTGDVTPFERMLLERLSRDAKKREAFANVFAHRAVPVYQFTVRAGLTLCAASIADPRQAIPLSADAARLSLNEMRWWFRLQASAVMRPRQHAATA